jgi:chemotaxis protein histidine kinase CheA
LNDPRDKLLDRFRSILLGRVRAIRDALHDLPEKKEGEDLIRRELHTLKGESRMLGLMLHSELSHALEECLPQAISAGAAAPAVRAKMLRAVDAFARSLDESVASDQAETDLVHALQSLVTSNGSSRPSAPSLVPPSRPSATDASDEGPPAEHAPVRGRWTQVETSAIDKLCARITELQTAYAELQARAGFTFARAELALHRDLFAPLVDDLERCRTSLDESTVNAWALRLVAAEPTLLELGRHAETTARSLGKPLDVRVSASGVQLESDVLDQLWASLLHLVQNAVAHGIEEPLDRGSKSPEGRLFITAESTGPSVILTVEDDGRGIDAAEVRELAVERGLLPRSSGALSDAELLELLCKKGFSTHSRVTALSGRGVGLDVVRSKIEALGGSLRLETAAGAGTRFLLNVPFAITKEKMLVIPLGAALIGLPVRLVRAVIAVDARTMEEGASVFHYAGESLPVRSLSQVLGQTREEEPNAAILELFGRRWAVRIPRSLGERDLIRTPADPLLLRTSPFGATALLEDGRLVLVPQLDRLTRLFKGSTVSASLPASIVRRRRVLVVDDSPVIRDLVSEVLATVGLDVTLAHDGSEGFRKVEESPPDLVLSDVEMPVMDGFEMLRKIREHSPRLPVVMLTTRASAEDRKRATSLGANAYLVKSEFQGGALIDVLSRFLDLRA